MTKLINNSIGSAAEGFTDVTSLIIASGNGSHAVGYAINSGTISATYAGAMAGGFSSDATINAGAVGAFVHGSAVGGSGYVTANSQGSFISAYSNSSSVLASNVGAAIIGFSRNISSLTSSGYGSLVRGVSDNGGTLTATSEGSYAGGYAYGTIQSTYAKAPWSFGYAGNQATMTASGKGSHAEGYVREYAVITSSGAGSHAEGSAYGGAKYSGYGIISSGNGSHAEGYGGFNGINLTSSNTGSHAEGWGTTASGIASHAQGRYSVASGECSFAFGLTAKADKHCQSSFSGGNFNVIGDAQASMMVLRASVSSASQTEIFLNGVNNRMTIAADTTWMFTINIAARRSDADNESAAYKIEGCIDNNAGTTALVGTITKTVIAEDTIAWDVTAEADNTNDALVVKVTGENAKTINWVALVMLTEVTG